MLKDRIFHIIEYKGITKNKFYKETGLSNGFLDKVKDVGVSKILKILSTYPEINLEWLVTGDGEMIKKEANTSQDSSNAEAKVYEKLYLDERKKNEDLVRENEVLRKSKVGYGIAAEE